MTIKQSKSQIYKSEFHNNAKITELEQEISNLRFKLQQNELNVIPVVKIECCKCIMFNSKRENPESTKAIKRTTIYIIDRKSVV